MAVTYNTIPTKRLAASISGSSAYIKLNNILGWDGAALDSAGLGDLLYAVLRDQENTIMEIMQLDPTTIANNSTTGITILRRGMKFNGDLTTEVTANKLVWVKNQTIVEIGTDVPQMFQSFVNVTGDQTVAGIKTFSSIPITNGGDPTTSNQLARKSYVDATLAGTVGTATDAVFGTVKTTKSYGAKPRISGVLVHEQTSPDKTLKIESFRSVFIDTIINYTGGNTPNFIDPGFGGDLALVTNPSATETFTVTVDGTAITFTAVTSIGATPGNFLIGGSATVTRANLAALINNPTVTSANQVALTGAQLTACQKIACTDDLSSTIFIRTTNTTVATFSASENFPGAGNTWTANTTKNRYDLVVVDSTSTLQIRKGTEAVSPTVPTPTTGDCVLALVFNKCGMTTVRDTSTDAAGINSYIVDLYSPSIYRTDIATTSSFYNHDFWGDGRDGDVTISSNSTISRDMYYNNLTINNGFYLDTSGYRIFIKGTLTINGTGWVGRTGNTGGNGGNGNSGGAGGAGGGLGTGATALGAGTLAGGLAGVNGGAGGAGINAGGGAGSGAPGSAGTAGTSQTDSVGSSGSSGATGGAGTVSGGAGGAGGAAGTATNAPMLPTNPTYGVSMHYFNNTSVGRMNTSAQNGGGGGGGGGGSPGGGGYGGGGGGAGGSGSTGGVVVVSAKTIVSAAVDSIRAKGGAGGTGGAGGGPQSPGGTGGGGAGGSGGAGGALSIVYHSMTGTTITSSAVAGGSGGTGGTGGNNGPTGTTGPNGALFLFQI